MVHCLILKGDFGGHSRNDEHADEVEFKLDIGYDKY